MGNVLFRCCTTSTNVAGGSRRRRSFWEKILSICGFAASSKQSRSSTIGGISSTYQRPCSERPSDLVDPAKHQRSVGQASSTRSMGKASVSLAQEDPREGLLHARREGRQLKRATGSNSLLSVMSRNSPDTARRLFNKHCYQKLQAQSPASHSPTIRGESPDSRMSFNPNSHQKLEAYSQSPLSRGSPDVMTLPCEEHCYQKVQGHSPISCDSPDMTSISFNQHFYQQLLVRSPTFLSSSASNDSPVLTGTTSYQQSYKQQHVNSPYPTSRSSPLNSSSIDMMRKSFNQHCNQQRHSAYPKKCQSPRRHNKPGSGKSSRRKRTGMRSMSHRTSNSKSPGRVGSGRIEDHEDKLNGMESQSRKSYDARSLDMAFSERIEDCKLLTLSHTTPNSKSLGRVLNEDNNCEYNSTGLYSKSHKTLNRESPGRTVKWRIDDNDFGGTPHPSFYQGRAAVVNIISRSAAIALIRRQTAFSNRRNLTHSSKHSRRHWKPALESIAEAGDKETF